jgi:hypothetical protein
MGLPHTWALLNLVHVFAFEEMCRIHGRSSKYAAFCGDDLLACMSDEEHETYQGLMQAFGFEFSAGKHFVSEDIGVFCETFFRRKTNKIRKYRTLSAKMLCPISSDKIETSLVYRVARNIALLRS